MEEFKTTIIEYIKVGYGDLTVNDLSAALAIEKYCDKRNFPSHWTEAQILADVKKNKRKIAMAAIEIDSKIGAENQKSHSENGINRTYFDGISAYDDVVPFVGV